MKKRRLISIQQLDKLEHVFWICGAIVMYCVLLYEVATY